MKKIIEDFYFSFILIQEHDDNLNTLKMVKDFAHLDRQITRFS